MAVLRVVDRRMGDRRKVTVSWADGSTLTHEMEVSCRSTAWSRRRSAGTWRTTPSSRPIRRRRWRGTRSRCWRRSGGAVRAGVRRAGRDAAWTWATAEADLAGVRVEVDADPADVPGVPWELLREPDSDRPVALGAAQFVRTHHRPPARCALPAADRRAGAGAAGDLPARWRGRRAVPVGGVAVGARRRRPAGRAGAGGAAAADVRPAGEVLRAAADAGRPYHVVHFDGHGAFLDAQPARRRRSLACRR